MLAMRCMALASLLTLVPALAVGQASAPALPDPTDPHIPVPALPDVSALAGYVPYQTPQVKPWRESNASVAPADASQATDPHAGHHMMNHPAPAPLAEPAAPAAPASGHPHHHAH
ncbi:hypothetical protein [Cupriavidus sp. DL-D2]|uniref:hypothetical protein n=1 Tax=Cupriavidus sp. DL-D2 TaxID=3144974 RepID=UPI003214BC97